MARTILLYGIAASLVFGFALPVLAVEAEAEAADVQVLQSAGVVVEGPVLLDFFRKRTLSAADRERVKDLIGRLGDNVYAVREQASADLVALGIGAQPELQQALKDPDLEVARRAAECLRLIEQRAVPAVVVAAAHRVGALKPIQAAETLLAYLPFADNEHVAEEVRVALTAVAMRDGRPEPVLVAALTDRSPLRRAAAAVALSEAGAREHLPAVRKLLQDPEPAVRLRVALALVHLKERDAIPVLIALFGDLPAAQLWNAEDLLRRLAGDQAPAVTLGVDDASRRKYYDAWAGWWRDHGAQADLGKLIRSQRMLGYTLVVVQQDKESGRVLELGMDGKPRWQITGLQYPLDAQVLPGERVLIAECNGNRVTERNFKGDILWEKQVQTPIAVQRLPNNHTFIATRSHVFEVDLAGKEVSKQTIPGFLMAARKQVDGRIGCIVGGVFQQFDADGRELKRWNVGSVQTVGGMDLLPGGRVLAVHVFANKVVEYDPSGKVVWEAEVHHPTSAVRLPNGNTLVACYDTGQVVELDPAGKTVWQYRTSGELSRARRR